MCLRGQTGSRPIRDKVTCFGAPCPPTTTFEFAFFSRPKRRRFLVRKVASSTKRVELSQFQICLRSIFGRYFPWHLFRPCFRNRFVPSRNSCASLAREGNMGVAALRPRARGRRRLNLFWTNTCFSPPALSMWPLPSAMRSAKKTFATANLTLTFFWRA